MPTLWGKVRHVSSSCRCTLCNPSRARVPNRVNLNTAPARRQPGINDSLTLFYGTFMAAALYTDASIKIGKKNELDRHILAEEKQAQSLEQSNRERLQALAFEPATTLNLEHGASTSKKYDLSMKELHLAGKSLSLNSNSALEAELNCSTQNTVIAKSTQTVPRHCETMRQAQNIRRQKLSCSTSDFERKQTKQKRSGPQKRLHSKQTQQPSNENRLSRLRDHILAPMAAALSGEMPVSRVTGKDAEKLWQSRNNPPVSRYWLKRQEVALTILVYQIKRYSDSLETQSIRSTQFDKTEPRITAQAQSLDELILDAEAALQILYQMQNVSETKLSQFRVRTCVSLNRHADSESHRVASRVGANNAICEAFARKAPLGSTLKDLCQILTDLKQPPDVHTFNVLMMNLNKLHCGPLAEMVWRAMRHCGLTCNELSVAAILRTHALTGSREKFLRVALSIDARDGLGILPWNAHTSELVRMHPESLSKPYWNSTMFMNLEGKVTAKLRNYVSMPRNEDMYDALVAGYLQFDDFESAGRELVEMIRAGFRPSLDLIIPILIQAIEVKDSQTSSLFGRSIFESVLQGTTAELREAVYIMAQIACQHNGLSDDCSADKILDQINSFAMQNDLLDQPLQAADLQELTHRQVEVIKERSRVARWLEQSTLCLRFEQSGTFDYTTERNHTMPQILGKQPANLLWYSAANLVHVHSQFVEERSSFATVNADNRQTSAVIEAASEWLQHRDYSRPTPVLEKKNREKWRAEKRAIKRRSKRKERTSIESAAVGQAPSTPNIGPYAGRNEGQDLLSPANGTISKSHTCEELDHDDIHPRTVFSLPRRTASLKSASSTSTLTEGRRERADVDCVGVQKWFVESSHIREYARDVS